MTKASRPAYEGFAITETEVRHTVAGRRRFDWIQEQAEVCRGKRPEDILLNFPPLLDVIGASGRGLRHRC